MRVARHANSCDRARSGVGKSRAVEVDRRDADACMASQYIVGDRASPGADVQETRAGLDADLVENLLAQTPSPGRLVAIAPIEG